MTHLNRLIVVPALVLALNYIAPAALAGSGIDGTWRMSSGKVTIRINYCGGKNICATVVGLAKPLNKQGKPKMDKNNPNVALKTRPIIGLQVANGLKPSGPNQWRGVIYNADDGHSYQGSATLIGNKLAMNACILGGLACKKKLFVRVN